MNVAYDLFPMIMTVIIRIYLTVWDNHHYNFNGHVHYLTLGYDSLNGLAAEYITIMFSLKTHSINLYVIACEQVLRKTGVGGRIPLQRESLLAGY